ncbi:hypothetical protein F3157_08005 [Virgibacillus dakarensis]|nr:hypothetical protein [Virgibacillus dakarensis]
MVDITEKQKQRAVNDHKTFLINELYKMGVDRTPDGRKIKDVRLFTLEQVHINEKCRMGKALGDVQ